MIRYNTSNDKVCKAVRRWCREKNYIYSFETNKEDKEFYVYPFTIVAPSYMENDLKEQIRKFTA